MRKTTHVTKKAVPGGVQADPFAHVAFEASLASDDALAIHIQGHVFG